MKTNYIPAIVTLTAGAIYCLLGIYTQRTPLVFVVQLLIVLLVFYVLGGIIRMVFDRFMGDVKEKSEEETEEEKEENSEDDSKVVEKTEETSERSKEEEM